MDTMQESKKITEKYLRKLSENYIDLLENCYPDFFNPDLFEDTRSVESEDSELKYSQNPKNLDIIPKVFNSNSSLGQNTRNDVSKAKNIILNGKI